MAAQIDDPATFVDQHIYDYRPGAPRYEPLYIAQINVPNATFSGVYKGNSTAPAASCLQTFEMAVQNNHVYTLSNCPEYGGTHTGFTWMSVSGDASITLNQPTNTCSDGTGSRIDFVATKDGKVTLCAGANSSTLASAWDYALTETILSSQSAAGFSFNVVQGTTYQITCNSQVLGATIALSSASGGTCSCTSQYICGEGQRCTCTAPADGQVAITTAGTTSPAYQLQVRAISAPTSRPTLPYDFSTQMPAGAAAPGVLCNVPRSCPNGYVATAINSYDDYFSGTDWTTKVSFTCKQIVVTNGKVTLNNAVAANNTCLPSAQTVAYNFDCDTGVNSPAVVIGQRTLVDFYGLWRIGPVCKSLVTGRVFNLDNAGWSETQCPVDTQVHSLDMTTNAPNGRGNFINSISMVCAPIVPLNPKQSCLGTYTSGASTLPLCGATAAQNPGACGCDAGCTAAGNCCPDYNLLCLPPPACGAGGVSQGGYCLYAGAASADCTSTCSTHGGYNEATRFYIGSNGTAAACQSALTSLGMGTGTVTDSSSCWDGGGCLTWSGSRYRCTAPTTNPTALFGGLARVCACNQ